MLACDERRLVTRVGRRRVVRDQRAFEKIWRVVARVPRGRVATYGQIARMAGLLNGARTVGWAMRALSEDRRIGGRRVPWHRVINAQGAISLRGGEDGGGGPRQAAALRRGGGPGLRGRPDALGGDFWGRPRERGRGVPFPPPKPPGSALGENSL